jgi:hypothetical protein
MKHPSHPVIQTGTIPASNHSFFYNHNSLTEKLDSCGYLYKFDFFGLFNLFPSRESKEGQKQAIRVAEAYKLCGF